MTRCLESEVGLGGKWSAFSFHHSSSVMLYVGAKLGCETKDPFRAKLRSSGKDEIFLD